MTDRGRFWTFPLVLAALGVWLLPLAGVGVVPLTLALAFLAMRSETVRRWFLPDQEPARALTLVDVPLLAGLGLVFLRVLIRNGGDNAYLLIAFIGFWLMAASVPFALATVIPHGRLRRWTVAIGFSGLYVIGSVSVLALGLIVAPTQADIRSEVYDSHALGLLMLGPVLALMLLGYQFLGRRRKACPASKAG